MITEAGIIVKIDLNSIDVGVHLTLIRVKGMDWISRLCIPIENMFRQRNKGRGCENNLLAASVAFAPT